MAFQPGDTDIWVFGKIRLSVQAPELTIRQMSLQSLARQSIDQTPQRTRRMRSRPLSVRRLFTTLVGPNDEIEIMTGWATFAKDPVHGLEKLGWPVYDESSEYSCSMKMIDSFK